MKVKITRSVFELAKPALKQFAALNEETFRWKNEVEIDLRLYELTKIAALADALISHKGEKVPGLIGATRDLKAWVAGMQDVKSAIPKTLPMLTQLLIEHMRNVPGHRVYKQEPGTDEWSAYYINKIEYHPPEKQRGWGGTIPAFVQMSLVYVEFGVQETEFVQFSAKRGDLGRTIVASLTAHGYVPETPEMRAEYLTQLRYFEENCLKVGKQFIARGQASDDIDGNPTRENDSWWYKQTRTVNLESIDGEPARVVIDVFQEDTSEKVDRRHRQRVDESFWLRKVDVKAKQIDYEEEEDENDEETVVMGEARGEVQDIEVPVHPYVAVFDLKRHLRLKTHMSNLVVHEYDKKLSEKLILPPEVHGLIAILVEQRSSFEDVISGKGGGSVILSAGPPGTGKTLTAEVYSETMGKPLYSVQASQLGLTAEDLESELLKTFSRAARWSAILLLDEADVYVRARGEDIEQNAIVGVFLRTLEYYRGVLFMTTNRSDLVDDAIASRCVARLDYKIPTREDQKRIWRVLADTMKVGMQDVMIEELVEVYDDLSGRDIKNLLKLAKLVADAQRRPVTVDVIKYVKQFKPTGGAASMGFVLEKAKRKTRDE